MRQTSYTPRLAFALALLLGATGAALAGDYTVGALQISHPWAPATAENAKTAEGYLTITNTGREPDSLISGSFIEASHVAIRSGAGKDGPIVINPGETVTLKPGGDHLTFVDLISPLHQGGTAQSILRFEKAGAIVLEFAVEGRSGKVAGASKGGHHQPH